MSDTEIAKQEERGEPCQNEVLIACSERMGRLAVQAGVVANSWKRDGLPATLHRIFGRLACLGRPGRPTRIPSRQAPGARREEVLDLQPGEWVRVKSREAIATTLDERGRHRGLVVMPEMLEHCGRCFRVHKRVRKMMLEGTGEMRRVKNTVLLEGSMCGGHPIGCDRSCFFFWREIWLERVEP